MTPPSPRALAQLFDEAQDLHQAGRLGEALERYKRILAADPRNGPALHMTGLLAFQNGQHQVAIDLMTNARQIGPPSAFLHSNLGLALRAAGRTDEAIASFRRALGLKPDTAETHNNLGMALLEQGEVDAAVKSFSRAAQLNPTLAAAHANLGDALWAQGKLEQAEECYLRAQALDAGDADLFSSLALLSLARGDADKALRRACQALAHEDAPRTHRVFAQIVQSVRWQEDDPQLRHYLTRAVAEGWSRPNAFTANAFSLIRARLAAGGSLRDDALLAELLTRVSISDALLERELTAARRQLLLQDGAADDFAAALAQQCFLNEYIWSAAADELAEVERLRQQTGALTEAQWAVLACYVPLGAEPGAARLQAESPALEAILVRQRDEPSREQELAKNLPYLTPARNLESVRTRYDAAPYPRWVQLKERVAPAGFRLYLASRFPAAAPDLRSMPDRPAVLVAGCGTGQYALEMAQEFALGDMLAVDLSPASLPYAARKAEEAGIPVAFAIADILELPKIGRGFDIIECRGVLHHLPDAFAGLRALLDCLNPGGVILTAFHSSRGRAGIARLRAWIAQEAFPPTDDGVRAARARLMRENAPENFGGIVDALPFYTTSACRELFFEQDEKTHTLQDVAAFLAADRSLSLVGIEVPEPVRAEYRRMFPGDPAAVNLSNWALFEAENPDTFASMYNLWLRKV
jgi:Flp pilus assembly protein TadD/SAM-dependent methyltransferase